MSIEQHLLGLFDVENYEINKLALSVVYILQIGHKN